MSPGALALLAAEERLSLLRAGSSADDGDGLAASAAALGWHDTQRAAADIVASFRQRHQLQTPCDSWGAAAQQHRGSVYGSGSQLAAPCDECTGSPCPAATTQLLPSPPGRASAAAACPQPQQLLQSGRQLLPSHRHAPFSSSTWGAAAAAAARAEEERSDLYPSGLWGAPSLGSTASLRCGMEG